LNISNTKSSEEIQINLLTHQLDTKVPAAALAIY